MTLEDEIAEAQSYSSDPPTNESNTERQIILPLLDAAGYAKRDIDSHVADNAGKYPDYTLLPNHSSATYYLEAKAWNENLEDKHVQQALNYANHNGKRFVVLTNGQSWRLYDNAVQGLPADKLIIQAALRDTAQITNFLTLLSKPEVIEGSLERMADEARQRKLQEAHDLQDQQQREEELQRFQRRQMEIRGLLSTTLPDLLNDSKSELVAIIGNHLNKEDEFKDIAPETLSAWFNENLHQSLEARGEQATSLGHLQMVHPPLPVQQGGRVMTLKELQGKPVDGKNSRPVILQAPDGTQTSVGSWVNLAEHVVRWLLQQPRPLPLPFESGNRKRWFLNHVPEHKRSDQAKQFKAITTHGKTVYMDADRSAEMFLKDVHMLCLAMQVDPNAFQITVLL